MIKEQLKFTLDLPYDKSIDSEKAIFIADKINDHIIVQLKEQRLLFTAFMKLPLEELEDIFHKNV